MSTSARTPWRLRATALACAGALATVAAVAPRPPGPDAPTGTDPVEARDEPTAPQASAPIEASATLPSPPLSEQVLIAASRDAVETAPEPAEPARPAAAADAEAETEAPAASAPEPEPVRSVWDRVADCESGEWTGDGGFVTASANWSATAGQFEGGLQFHPDTWDGYRDTGMPAAAYEASRAQQIVVAERVLAEQGWKAWPVCSRKLGLR